MKEQKLRKKIAVLLLAVMLTSEFLSGYSTVMAQQEYSETFEGGSEHGTNSGKEAEGESGADEYDGGEDASKEEGGTDESREGEGEDASEEEGTTDESGEGEGEDASEEEGATDESEDSPQKPSASQEEKADSDPEPEEIQYEGRILFMDDGTMDRDSVNLAVYLDGKRTSAQVWMEEGEAYGEEAEHDVWTYFIAGVPEGEEGVLTIADKGWKEDEEGRALFFLDENGEAVPMNEGGCDNLGTDLIYVSKQPVEGVYEIDMESLAEAVPEDEEILIAVTGDNDTEYNTIEYEIHPSREEGLWSAGFGLCFHPENGEEIVYSAQVTNHREGIHAVYFDLEDEEREYASPGGRIRIVPGEDTLKGQLYTVAGTIVWEDKDNLHGYRPQDLGFLRVWDQDDRDVTGEVIITAGLPDQQEPVWNYSISGLTEGESYRVSIEAQGYEADAVLVAVTDISAIGDLGLAEPIEARLKVLEAGGYIRWNELDQGSRPEDLSFLHVYADGEEVTEHLKLAYTEHSSQGYAIWEYTVEGLLEGMEYTIRPEALEGYSVSREEMQMRSRGRSVMRDLVSTALDSFSMVQTKTIQGTIWWEDESNALGLRPGLSSLARIIGLEEEYEENLTVREEAGSGAWLFTIENLPWTTELAKNAPRGYSRRDKEAALFTLTAGADSQYQMTLLADKVKLNIKNTSYWGSSGAESGDFTYKISWTASENEVQEQTVTVAAGQQASVEVPANFSITVKQDIYGGDLDTKMFYLYGVKKDGGSLDAAAEGEVTVTTPEKGSYKVEFVNSKKRLVAATINWNDNSDEGKARPMEEKFRSSLRLMQAVVGGTPSVTQLYDRMNGPDTTAVGSNTWNYSYEGVPSTDEAGNELTYSLSVGSSSDSGWQDSYLTEYPDGLSVRNTLLWEMNITKVWKDNSDDKGMRPGQDALKNSLVLQRALAAGDSHTWSFSGENNSSEAWTTEPRIDIGAAEDDSNSQSIKISRLIKFDPDGMPYIYTLTESALPEAADGITYQVTYENQGNYAHEDTRVYHEGTITNTIQGETVFNATKYWKDPFTGTGNTEEQEKRPTASLHFYRYAKGSGDYQSASPVPGVASVVLEKADEYKVTVEHLDRFDKDGQEYVYFARETMADTSDGLKGADYKQIITNEAKYANEAGNDVCVFNGGTLVNKRTQMETYSAKKIWKSSAYQDLGAEVTLCLKRKNSSGEEESAGEIILRGFDAEHMERTGEFAPLDRFDENGKEYGNYTIEETEVKNHEKNAVIDSENQTFTTHDGYLFRSEIQPPVNGGTEFVVTNTLIGDTKVVIDKIWKPVPSGNHKISFSIYRNSSGPVATISMEVKDGKVVTDGDSGWKEINPSSEGDETRYRYVASVDIDGKSLPKYDENGGEYVYTVTEDLKGLTGYGHTISYSRITAEEAEGNTEAKGPYASYPRAVVSNHITGPGKYIRVTKEWLDGGDSQHREAVIAGLYDSAGNPVADGDHHRTVTLSESNNWQGWLDVSEIDNTTLAGYLVREVSVGANENKAYYEKDKVTEEFLKPFVVGMTEVENTPDSQKVTLSMEDGSGIVDTEKHIYAVTTRKISENTGTASDSYSAEWKITNRRLGLMSVEAEKKWIAGTGPKPDVEVTLITPDGIEESDIAEDQRTKTISFSANPDSADTNNTCTFSSLPKYALDGHLYTYGVRESSIGTGNGKIVVSEGSSAFQMAEEIDDEQRAVDYSIAVTEESYTTGDRHTGDVLKYQITNQRTGNWESPVVYKRWMDGTVPSDRKRPDIVLKVYRHISSAPSENELVSEYKDHIWTTTEDSFWICTFDQDQFPKYDENGNLYHYFVKETILGQPGDYSTSYYKERQENEAPKAEDYLSDEGAAAEDNARTGAPLGGTIVNKRQAKTYVNGRKIWRNVPNSMKPEDYPKVTLTLKRAKYSDQDYDWSAAESVEDGQGKDLIFTLDMANNPTGSFQFGGTAEAPELEKYTDTGHRYVYHVTETKITGGYDQSENIENPYEPSFDRNSFILTNTYTADTNLKLTLNKTWDNLPADMKGGDYPKVELKLYSAMQDNTGTRLEYTKADTGRSTPEPDNSNGTWTYTYEGLPVYAPNGYAYQYWIEEVPIKGYGEAGKDQSTEFDITEEGIPKEGTASLVNTYNGGSLSISGTKTWNDSSNTYTLRPTKDEWKAKLTLSRWAEGYDGGKREAINDIVITVTPGTDANQWSYRIQPPAGESFLRYAPNGKPYHYEIKEGKVNGYSENVTADVTAPDTGDITGLNITNTLKTTSLKVIKKWEDKNNIYQTRPEKIEVEVLQKAERSESHVSMNPKNVVTISQSSSNTMTAGQWSHTITNLPAESKDGKAYSYTIKELAEGGQDTGSNNWRTHYVPGVPVLSGEGTQAVVTVTNKLIEEEKDLRSFTVKKMWEDGENVNGLRPDTITLGLCRDGNDLTGTGMRVTLGADGKIVVPENEKGALGEHVDLKANTDEPWTITWLKLPVYKNGSSTDKSVYTVKEYAAEDDEEPKPPAYYTVTYESLDVTLPLPSEGINYRVTNAYTPIDEVRIAVRKYWEDQDDAWKLRPDTVTLQLYKQKKGNSEIEKVEGKSATAEVSKLDGSDAVFTNLSFAEDKVPLIYYVEETKVNGYQSLPMVKVSLYPDNAASEAGEGDSSKKVLTGSCELTNRLDTLSVAVEKKWEDGNNKYGLRPDQAEIQLLRSIPGQEAAPLPGGIGPAEFANGTVTLGKGGDGSEKWSHTWSNLPRYDKEGKEYSYTVRENNPSQAYTPLVSGQEKEGTLTFTVTNSLNKRSSLKVQKVWHDADNYGGIRPESVTLQLKSYTEEAPDELTDRGAVVTVNNSGTPAWSYTWSDLPQKDSAGNILLYTVEETPVQGYETAVTGAGTDELTVTNTMTAIKYKVEKRWEDQNNLYKTRPEIIQVVLQRKEDNENDNGWTTLERTDLSEENNWKNEFTNLPPKTQSGIDYKYRVREAAVLQGYTAAYEENTVTENEVNTGITRITNTLEVTQLTGTKTWDDSSNKFKTRPSSVALKVYAGEIRPENLLDPQPQPVWQNTDTDTWNWTISKLPKKDAAGKDIDYQVTEDVSNVQHPIPAVYKAEATSENQLVNTLRTGSLKVSKVLKGGQPGDKEKEFLFKVTLTAPETNAKLLYTGEYEVAGEGIDQNPQTVSTAADGSIKIKAGQHFTIKDLPHGYKYQVEEIGGEYRYNVEQIGTTGTVEENQEKAAVITNNGLPRLMITNMTAAETTSGRVTAGGRVSLTDKGGGEHSDHHRVPYYEEALAVSWVQENHWLHGNKLTVRYREAGEQGQKVIVIDGILNQRGEVKPFSDPVYDPLKQRFPNAELSQTQAIPGGPVTLSLKLADELAGMPLETAVEVWFAPTLQGHNLSKYENSGQVRENGHAWSSESGTTRYHAVSITGQAENSYQVDSASYVIGGPQLENPVTLMPDSSGAFQATVRVKLYSADVSIVVKGSIKSTDGKEAVITLDALPVPLDLGLGFVPVRNQPIDSGGGSGSGSGGKRPAAGLPVDAGPGVPKTEEAVPSGSEGLLPENMGQPTEYSKQMNLPPEVSRIHIYDNEGNRVYEGAARDFDGAGMTQGRYRLVSIGEGGVPLTEYTLYIDEFGVPKGVLPKTGKNRQYLILVFVISALLFSALLLIPKLLKRKKK